MKIFRVAIFLGTFFVLYFLINFYIYNSGYRALNAFAPERTLSIYHWLFVFIVFSFPVARIFGKWLPVKVADSIAFIGGMWFAAILYLSLSLVVIDLSVAILKFSPAFQNMVAQNYGLINAIVFSTLVVLVLILLSAGYFNAMSPKVKKLSLNIRGSNSKLEKLHLVFASDIHLGHVIGKKSLSKILNKINALKPDLILFPGDIVDEELKPVIDKNLGELFKTLTPKYGTFAVTGNHEYIGGAEAAVNYLSKFGIKFLRDEAVNIDNLFYIAGREDMSITSFYGKNRKPIKEILNGYEKSLPVILMDHQPIALLEAAESRVDLQISGHTHHGQMWPLQEITKRVFKLSWGYKKIKSTHFYVSSGAGTWGPRVRIGNHPEVVSIEIDFTTQT